MDRGQGGDHMIAKDVTAPFVEGWDWILPVPDRNTGLWDHVELCYTGPVALQVSKGPFPTTTVFGGMTLYSGLKIPSLVLHPLAHRPCRSSAMC